MNLWKLIACLTLLGLLSGMSFAQRGRLSTGGTAPGARSPSAWTLGRGTSHTPIPATTASSASKTQPSATTSPAAKTVSPNTHSAPATMTPLPNSRDWGNGRGVGPVQ